MLDPNRPYNELPPLPPKADVETRAILKKWGLARTALAEMRLAGPLIPDPAVLISSIPLLEAKDSSEIENIVTTNDALFREASLGPHFEACWKGRNRRNARAIDGPLTTEPQSGISGSTSGISKRHRRFANSRNSCE